MGCRYTAEKRESGRLGGGCTALPLTSLQNDILTAISVNRSPENYIAGGTVLHFEPNTIRYSRDLDIFHDALEAVAPSFEADRKVLLDSAFTVDVIISQPGFIRAIVKGASDATQIDWARDSAWRFMPVSRHYKGVFMLHEVDAAINKILALAGRREPRDYVDALYIMQHILPLGALVWAAVAKDPGFTPLSLLEHMKRQGRYRPEEFARLDLVKPFDLKLAKTTWLNALGDAESFISSRPASEMGCLYYDAREERFAAPVHGSDRAVLPHYGSAGGILPRPSQHSL